MAMDFPSGVGLSKFYPNRLAPDAAYFMTTNAWGWNDGRGRAERYNRAVNGAFQVSQQNQLTDGTVSGLAMADEYVMFWTSDVGVFRGQRLLTPSPKGSINRLRVTVNTADPTLTAGEWLSLMTRFEGTNMGDLRWGTSSSAVPIIIRFGWKSPAGTYCISIRNNAADYSYVAPFTITAGQANTDTEQIFLIPPAPPPSVWPIDTTRWGTLYWIITNANTTSQLNQWVSGNFAGANTMTNNINVAGNVFELFDVGVYADPYYTGIPPDWELPDQTTEIRRCQRYYAKIYSMRGVVGTATLISRASCLFPVPMRIVPSLSIRGTPRFWDGNAGNPVTAIGSNWSSTVICAAEITCGAGGYTLYRTAGQYLTDPADCIVANARM